MPLNFPSFSPQSSYSCRQRQVGPPITTKLPLASWCFGCVCLVVIALVMLVSVMLSSVLFSQDFACCLSFVRSFVCLLFISHSCCYPLFPLHYPLHKLAYVISHLFHYILFGCLCMFYHFHFQIHACSQVSFYRWSSLLFLFVMLRHGLAWFCIHLLWLVTYCSLFHLFLVILFYFC